MFRVCGRGLAGTFDRNPIHAVLEDEFVVPHGIPRLLQDLPSLGFEG